MRIHREPGWWIPVSDRTTDLEIAELKAAILDANDAVETSLGEIAGRRDGELRVYRLGEESTDAGRVMAILRARDDDRRFYVVSPQHGINSIPLLVDVDELDLSSLKK